MKEKKNNLKAGTINILSRKEEKKINQQNSCNNTVQVKVPAKEN